MAHARTLRSEEASTSDPKQQPINSSSLAIIPLSSPENEALPRKLDNPDRQSRVHIRLASKNCSTSTSVFCEQTTFSIATIPSSQNDSTFTGPRRTVSTAAKDARDTYTRCIVYVGKQAYQYSSMKINRATKARNNARHNLKVCSTTNATCGGTINGEPTLIQPAEQNPQTATLTQTSTHDLTSSQEAPTTSLAPAIIHEAPPPPSKPTVAPAKEAAPAQKPMAIASHPLRPAGEPTFRPSQWAITYSPYTAQGNCKPSTDVAADVALIAQKGFSSIRLYSTDCNGLSTVGGPAITHNLTLILGVYISEDGIPAAEPQIQDIIDWATSSPNPNDKWKTVEMIIIGSSSLSNNFTTPSALANFLTSSRITLGVAGYTNTITTAEPIPTLLLHSSILCPLIDTLAAPIHPFFSPGTTASDAGEYVSLQLQILDTVCSGGDGEKMEAWNIETGWPSRGSANGVAVPGWWEQNVA
ncbi:MAG: hypothetical protein Q9228_006918, partial [Teloschistes exilis]